MRYSRCPWLVRRMPSGHTLNAQGKVRPVPIATNVPVENRVAGRRPLAGMGTGRINRRRRSPSGRSAPFAWTPDVVSDAPGARVARPHGHWTYKHRRRRLGGDKPMLPNTPNAHLVSNGLRPIHCFTPAFYANVLLEGFLSDTP